MNIKELHSKLHNQNDALKLNDIHIKRVEKFANDARIMNVMLVINERTMDRIVARCKVELKNLFIKRGHLKAAYTAEYDKQWKLRSDALSAAREYQHTKEGREVREKLTSIVDLLGDDLDFLLKHQNKL
ncbi:hypothetical protein NVP2058O_142 [Vibrio phage 2.058.O._10N.286.46.B8]|nr:hypothetical protein NVP2058O_142 [Vibrio phage 2.058.O._10N.286.46.B8]